MPPLTIKTVEFLKSATRPEHFPADALPQLAFVGRSNVGKSSLLNVLVNRRRIAMVSSTPGRTQLVNFFTVNGSLYFVDLPGYGFAKAPQSVRRTWEKMITGYLQENARLKGVFALFDIRRDPTDEDRALLQWLAHYGIPFVAVVTKADKLARGAQAQALKKLEAEFAPYAPRAVHLFSAQTRAGRDAILGTAGDLLGG
jgi:GTP-binding protein